MIITRISLRIWLACFGSVFLVPIPLSAQVVPGTGTLLPQAGDNFEDPNWKFFPNLPKSSEEIDKQTRLPAGRSSNGRWYEGMKRGCPDSVLRVPTPAHGLPGSQFALQMQSVHTGVPRSPSYQMQQDDFVANVWQLVGYKIPAAHTPSVVVRVFMPPIKTWENRTGVTFGFRTALETHTWKVPEDAKWIKKKEFIVETYWPGMFVEFHSEHTSRAKVDTAFWRIRGNTRGAEVNGPDITMTGWWTLGMTITPDGMVHYYAKQGIEDLTADDLISSQFPYGYKAESLKTFFFNVCSVDDGKTPSTPWIIDDPAVYVATPPRQMARR